MVNVVAFDCDGVLRDESLSYTRCILETVGFFDNGKNATLLELSESMKNSNDDWERTYTILKNRGILVDFEIVKNHFQDLYLGKKRDFSGYINNEPWLIDNNLLKELLKYFKLVIVSGAPIDEIKYTLNKNNAEAYFDFILGMFEIENKKQGLEIINSKYNPDKIFFCDDRPSPIKQTSELKNVFSYGIFPPNFSSEWKEILIDAGAKDVFFNVNDYIKFLLLSVTK